MNKYLFLIIALLALIVGYQYMLITDLKDNLTSNALDMAYYKAMTRECLDTLASEVIK